MRGRGNVKGVQGSACLLTKKSPGGQVSDGAFLYRLTAKDYLDAAAFFSFSLATTTSATLAGQGA